MARGRPRAFDRDKALQDAMHLFWRKGFHSTSTAELCDALGVSTPSLYAAFGNKEKLYAEAVQLYMKATQTLLWGYLDSGRTLRAGMRDILIAIAKEGTNGDAHPVGCLISTAFVDEDMPVSVANAIKKARRDWLDVIRAHIGKAVDAGELASSTDVKSLTRFFLATIQGMSVQANDGAKRTELEAMVETAMEIWPKKTTKK